MSTGEKARDLRNALQVYFAQNGLNASLVHERDADSLNYKLRMDGIPIAHLIVFSREYIDDNPTGEIIHNLERHSVAHRLMSADTRVRLLVTNEEISFHDMT